MYITVKEASDLTGKSPTTIYRLCNKRRNSVYIKKEDNKFLINKEFLLATYPPEERMISDEIEFGDTTFEKSLEANTDETNTTDYDNEIMPDEIPDESIVKVESIIPEKEEKATTHAEEPIKGATIEFVEPIQIEEVADKLFYHKPEFWEKFLGVSFSLLAIAVLLFLFYYAAK